MPFHNRHAKQTTSSAKFTTLHVWKENIQSSDKKHVVAKFLQSLQERNKPAVTTNLGSACEYHPHELLIIFASRLLQLLF
jgi:hypothetical protein